MCLKLTNRHEWCASAAVVYGTQMYVWGGMRLDVAAEVLEPLRSSAMVAALLEGHGSLGNNMPTWEIGQFVDVRDMWSYDLNAGTWKKVCTSCAFVAHSVCWYKQCI